MNHTDITEDGNDIILLGAQLRELREAQGLMYDDIAKRTHVRPHILKAIEDGNLDDIAARVYVRGFVRTYCEYLMAHDLWKKYNALLSVDDSPRPKNSGLYRASMDISHPRPVFKRTSIIWVYIVLIVAVVGAAFLLWNQYRNPDGAQSGFFLRFTSGTPRDSSSETGEPRESGGDNGAETVPAASGDADARAVVPPVVDEVVLVSSDEYTAAAVEPRSVDLSWLDGNEPERSNGNITVPLSQIPDRRLLIETVGPVRLIVQQDGSVVTRRSLGAGGVRSYDVTGATPVSFSAGAAADVTWNGKKYSPVGGDNKPLAMTFYPDGSVNLTEGTSPHFKSGMNSPGGN